MNPRSTQPDIADAPTVETTGRAAGDDAWREFVEQIRARGPNWQRYQRGEKVAEGGMGAILSVFDRDLRRTLAMKVILERDAGAAAAPSSRRDLALGRFLEEAQVTGQLDHPGIVPVHELGVDADGSIYFTMKLVRGDDLRTVFHDVHDPANTEWNRTRALGVLLKVCDAMAYAHAKGVLHRDLKPGNVMVGKFGEAYVMDWGLARVMHHPEDRDIRIRPPSASESPTVSSARQDAAHSTPLSPLVTMDGDVVGTPAYMPPEQAAGRLDEIGPHSDVYSLGTMLYHLLTGRAPYVEPQVRTSPATLLLRVLRGPPRPVHELVADVPAELQAICERAMARDPAARYATMLELASDLRAYLEERVVAAYESGPFAEIRKWVARNRVAARTAAAAALLLVAVTAGFLLNLRRQRDFAREQQARVLRLADTRELDRLLAQVDDLWPAVPERAAAMQTWLDQARELVGRRADHAATLASLERDLAAAGGQERSQILWWSETLRGLLLGLDDLTRPDPDGGAMRRLEARLAFAESVRAVSIEQAQADWELASRAIADKDACPQYDGLVLSPQLGLVPIGQDPDSRLFEFWHIQSGERPARAADGRLVRSEQMGLVFVLLPGGETLIGSQSADPAAARFDVFARPEESDERGRPTATVLAPFLLSKYEMTQGQWWRLTHQRPSVYAAGKEFRGTLLTDLHPLEHVSFDQCSLWLERLDLALPSEAQWEYACRAGTDSPYHSGADLAGLEQVANLLGAESQDAYASGALPFMPGYRDGFDIHAPVGSLLPNDFGLYDMHGNVLEWCADERGSVHRAFRGGAYNMDASQARSAARNATPPSKEANNLGLRPAKTLKGTS